MSDTQWPRFEVFQQENKGEPHQNANSIHAPDAEMALMNARDVFVRRPNCYSLWVVPTNRIFSKTAQELADPAWINDVEQDLAAHDDLTSPETYYVFQKLKHQGKQTYAGQVEARTPVEALRRALDTFTAKQALGWWVFPARWVTQSTPDDIESMFTPALDKTFRDQSFYHTVALMHQIKKKAQQEEG